VVVGRGQRSPPPAADLREASVDDPDVFVFVRRERGLLQPQVQIVHRQLLTRQVVHARLQTHTRARTRTHTETESVN